MISGNKAKPLPSRRPELRRRASALLLALAWALALPAPNASAQPAQSTGAFDLAALLSMLGKATPSRATFNERKFLRQLDAPVDSAGELLFEPPATLTMRTLVPKVETMRVDGQTLTLERARLQRTLQLAEHPEIAVYVEPIRAALAGDRAALERGYRVELRGDSAQWKLQLTPKAGAVGTVPIAVESLQLSGRAGDVRQIEVRLTDGDYSIMNIEPAAPL